MVMNVMVWNCTVMFYSFNIKSFLLQIMIVITTTTTTAGPAAAVVVVVVMCG